MEQYIKSTERVGKPYLYVDQKKHSVGINCFPIGYETLEVNGINVLNQPKARYTWSGFATNDQTSTTPTTIDNLNTTLTTHGGDLFISVSLPFYQSGGTGNIKIYVDYVEKATIIHSNSTSKQQIHGEAIITGISAGTHTIHVSMQPQDSSYTCIIGSYMTKQFTIIEL